jgi:hypothetical protein
MVCSVNAIGLSKRREWMRALDKAFGSRSMRDASEK